MTVIELCHCGRPLRHKGRHVGSSVPKKSNMVAMAEAEVSVVHAEIVRLKREIQDRQHALITAEAKLQPLNALLLAYQPKRIEGPPAPVAVAVAPSAPAPVIPAPRPAQPDDDNDYSPIEADFNQVLKWAAARGLQFKTWDDLPAINARRTRFELPTFKKKLSVRS